MTTSFVGLGSNLGDRLLHLHEAVARLGRLEQSRLVTVSSIYETEPIGDPREPRYLNAVARLETTLSPRNLLGALQGFEAELGRPRLQRSGPRTIDLDLLLHGDQVLAEPGLVVPHPRMCVRAFVMIPLAEIEPRLVHPVIGDSMADLARRAPGRPGVCWTGHFQEVGA